MSHSNQVISIKIEETTGVVPQARRHFPKSTRATGSKRMKGQSHKAEPCDNGIEPTIPESDSSNGSRKRERDSWEEESTEHRPSKKRRSEAEITELEEAEVQTILESRESTVEPLPEISLVLRSENELAPTNRTRATAPSPPGSPKRARQEFLPDDPPCQVTQAVLDGGGGVLVRGRRLRSTPERLRSLGILPPEAPMVRRVTARKNAATTKRKPRRRL